MNLSEHLSLAEVLASDTAKRLGVPNEATDEHVQNLTALAGAIFEPLRVHMQQPVYVSSGYRSESLNDVLPGRARKSQHMTGEALDLDQQGRETGVTNREVFLWIRDNLPFDQLIWELGSDVEPDWVHVSYTRHRRRRGEVLRGRKDASGTVTYVPWWGPRGASRR